VILRELGMKYVVEVDVGGMGKLLISDDAGEGALVPKREARKWCGRPQVRVDGLVDRWGGCVGREDWLVVG